MTPLPMSVRHIAKTALFWGSLGCASLVLAAEEMQPDIEFLEYLGSWESSDEDWLMFHDEADRRVVVDDRKQSDSEPKAKESTESKDES